MRRKLALLRRRWHVRRRHPVILTVLNDVQPGVYVRGFWCLRCHKGWRS